MRVRVNLIALNPGAELPYRTPADERVRAFREILVASGILAFVRRPRGRDIFAACGQLKREGFKVSEVAELQSSGQETDEKVRCRTPGPERDV
jgi:adenine C2-methylase RlmN of 23S rRNA A2503 and tRNA A37